MSYYPVLVGPQCEGVTTVFNLAPNNWERGDEIPRYLNVSFSDDSYWNNSSLGIVDYGDSVTVTRSELSALTSRTSFDTTFFLTLLSDPAPRVSQNLPNSCVPAVSAPTWRGSLELTAPTGVSTSYQGEIDPFPVSGSLVTFGYFLQFSSSTKNFLLFVNLEKSAAQRTGLMEIRDAKKPSVLVRSFEVKNNRVNIIPLDNLGFSTDSLPLFLCRQMSGVPLFFSSTLDFTSLSLEHTHPPASTVVHGDRFTAQRLIKNYWFSRAKL